MRRPDSLKVEFLVLLLAWLCMFGWLLWQVFAFLFKN
jgi:hypothetical protein